MQRTPDMLTELVRLDSQARQLTREVAAALSAERVVRDRKPPPSSGGPVLDGEHPEKARERLERYRADMYCWLKAEIERLETLIREI